MIDIFKIFIQKFFILRQLLYSTYVCIVYIIYISIFIKKDFVHQVGKKIMNKELCQNDIHFISSQDGFLCRNTYQVISRKY